MPNLERRFGPVRGARFFLAPVEHASDCALNNAPAEEPLACDCGAKPVLMFVNHLDGSTRDGPRTATQADAEAHKAAWATFIAEETGADAPASDGVEVVIEGEKGDGEQKASVRKRAAA